MRKNLILDSITLSKSAASFKTLLDTISSSLLCGFCSIWNWEWLTRSVKFRRDLFRCLQLTCKYKFICSVIRTEMLRYFRLILVPRVMKRRRKHPKAHDQISASKLCWDCKCTESLSHSTLRNANKRRVNRNAAETITSTDRWGPRFWKKNCVDHICYFAYPNRHSPSNKISHSTTF